MSDGKSADFLVEIGTEELPPKALRTLTRAFADGLVQALDDVHLAHGDARPYASPRRLAVRIDRLALGQDDRETEQKGPPVSVAFDKEGKPTRAALAFADKCGVAVDALQRASGDKGEWLVHRSVARGQSARDLLPGLVRNALEGLPVPRRMRWGDHDAEFVRPVHWVVLLHGSKIIDGELFGIRTGRHTRGHRFHAPGPLPIDTPSAYPAVLTTSGYVIADFDQRRERIETGVTREAVAAGGHALGDDALYDEVAALTEWPVAMTGRFDAEFLELPKEVIVASLTGHQRYFPVADDEGNLLPTFITVANIESREPGKVRDGNERVIRPRLADAAFFWRTDRRTSLATRRASLGDVVYQRDLGTMLEKSARLSSLARQLADALDADAATAVRAAELSKCDLLTGMVGEFPELQGVMGRHYALADGETPAVADAIGEHYQPRFAGDALPLTEAGRILAMADRLDALCGVFALGQKPSGNRDPFGLRRAALGIVRIIVEGHLDADLFALIDAALQLQPVAAGASTRDDVYDFIVERMRGLCLERGDVTSEMFEAVRCRRLGSLLDIDARLNAVVAFVRHDAAESLAAANKRIANILRQANYTADDEPDTALFDAAAEQTLYGSMHAARDDVAPLLNERRYTEVLTRLADLRQPVDAFFDDVMVMADDEAVKQNRLALLARLRAQFLDVADISRLSIGKN